MPHFDYDSDSGVMIGHWNIYFGNGQGNSATFSYFQSYPFHTTHHTPGHVVANFVPPAFMASQTDIMDKHTTRKGLFLDYEIIDKIYDCEQHFIFWWLLFPKHFSSVSVSRKPLTSSLCGIVLQRLSSGSAREASKGWFGIHQIILIEAGKL